VPVRADASDEQLHTTGLEKVARFFGPNIPKREKYIYQMAPYFTKWPQIIPNGRKLCTYTKWLLIIRNGRKIHRHLPFQGRTKYAQIGILNLRLNHLATLGLEKGRVTANQI
jgi:hypothetical protein